LLAFFTNNLFADAKKELENCIKKDVNSSKFQSDDKLITTLVEKGSKLVKEGKFDKAMQYYKKALVKADKLYGAESTAAAMIYTSMGTLFLKKNEKIKAADSLVKAYNIYKNSMGGMVNCKADRLLLMQAGCIYFDANLYRQAWKTLKKAGKDIAKFTPDEKIRYLPKLYRYLALSCFKNKKYEEAIPYLRKSLELELAKKSVNYQELAVINLFLGEALLKTKQFGNSLTSLLDSKKYFNSCKPSTFYQFKLYLSLSLVNESLGKNKDNLLYAQKLNDICKKFDSTDFRKIVGLVYLADAMLANDRKKMLLNL